MSLGAHVGNTGLDSIYSMWFSDHITSNLFCHSTILFDKNRGKCASENVTEICIFYK